MNAGALPIGTASSTMDGVSELASPENPDCGAAWLMGAPLDVITAITRRPVATTTPCPLEAVGVFPAAGCVTSTYMPG
jgi:hypothetical protein